MSNGPQKTIGTQKLILNSIELEWPMGDLIASLIPSFVTVSSNTFEEPVSVAGRK